MDECCKSHNQTLRTIFTSLTMQSSRGPMGKSFTQVLPEKQEKQDSGFFFSLKWEVYGDQTKLMRMLFSPQISKIHLCMKHTFTDSCPVLSGELTIACIYMSQDARDFDMWVFWPHLSFLCF